MVNYFGWEQLEVFNFSDDACLPIKPSIDLNPPTDMTKYYFDINLLRDFSVHLPLQPAAESKQINTTSSTSNLSVFKKPCFICCKKFPLSDMLCLVGMHIHKEDIKGANVWILWP